MTKLPLLLKVLEGESGETLMNQLKLFHERALPDLSGNIRCGNSLIDPDFYEGTFPDLLSEEDRYRINVFDWKAEFPGVFAAATGRKPSSSEKAGGAGRGGTTAEREQGGFDAVIGNPPCIRIRRTSNLSSSFLSAPSTSPIRRTRSATTGWLPWVEEMRALHRQLAAARTDHERTNLKRQIDATDRRIDRLVYELYDLTDEEIRIVENG